MDEESMKTIIEETFQKIINDKQIDNIDHESPQLIRPIYSPLNINNDEDKMRYSEQEVKITFIDKLKEFVHLKLNDDCKKVYYSIETPTFDKYNFSKEDIPFVSPDGESGNIDLSIYSSEKYIENYIEFKYGTASSKKIMKDILKLANEPFCPKSENESKLEEINNLKDVCSDGKIATLQNKKHYFVHAINRCTPKTEDAIKDYYSCNNHGSKPTQQDLNKLKTEIKKILSSSHNTIYVYLLVLNRGNQKPYQSGYFEFRFDEQVFCSEWEWHKYIKEDGKDKYFE